MQAELSCNSCRDSLLDFIENSIDQESKRLVDQHLTHCEQCNESLRQLWEMQALSTRWNDESVPAWSRRNTFFESYNWWPGLQLVSTFASLLVVVLVMSQVQFSTKDGITLAFGSGSYLTQTELNQKVEEMQARQANMLQSEVGLLNTQQVETNQLLLRTFLDLSREERREEINTVLTAWDQAQGQRTRQTNESLRVLLASQLEDRRNIEQLDRLLRRVTLEGNEL